MKNIVRTTFVLICIAIGTKLAFTYSQSSPPAGHANDPGQANCTACHSGTLISSGTIWNGMSLTSSVALGSFLPNTTYTMNLTFADPGSTKYGFQLVALPSGATSLSTSVGTITATSTETATQTSSGRTYINHSSTGTTAASNTKTWSFNWTTPAAFTGGVSFYVVVNSTDEDGTNQGDQIYAKVFSATVLPVKWLSYDIEKQKSGVQISWSTASEVNSSHYEIEKSIDQKTWQTAGQVKAGGHSNATLKYTYFDDELDCKPYYRIKQVDFDGAYSYSRVLFAGKDVPQEKVSYDPIIRKIKVAVVNSSVPVKLYSMAGVVRQTQIGNEDMDVSGLESGIYFLLLPSGKTEKILVY